MTKTYLRMETKHAALQAALERVVDKRKIFGTSFSLKYKECTWQGASGNLKPESPYFIASTTKLFTTAVILHLRSEGAIRLDDHIHRYLPQDLLWGLHHYRGTDYSDSLTIRHLMAHTSGLPDYFLQKNREGRSLEKELVAGKDQSWTARESIERSKTLPPKFAPGTSGKAYYSDTNFQLLGLVIESLSGKSVDATYQSLLIQPLGLKSTYLYTDPLDGTPQPFYYKDQPMHIPKAMASFGPDGGIVSTSADVLRFLEAFFTGKFFPVEYVPELRTWNPIFFPLKSGVGIQSFKLPWLMDPTRTIPHLIGHSGLSGALAFCNPEMGLYISGTANQLAHPDASFRLMIKLARIVLK